MRFHARMVRLVLALPFGPQLLGQLRVTMRVLRPVGSPRRLLRRANGQHSRRAEPWKDHDWLVIATRFDERDLFLSTNQVAARCRFIFMPDGSFQISEDRDNNWYFVRTNDLHTFFERSLPTEDFVLFSGHSDYPVDRSHRPYLSRPNLKTWFAVNPLIRHPKLHAMPLGVGSPCWGDTTMLRTLKEAKPQKTQLFHAAFSLISNPFERHYCLEQIRESVSMEAKLQSTIPWEEYLSRVAASYFCISPKGAGIDSVRTWESLVVGTIPVVTRSVMTDEHRDYPMVVLDDWAQFRSVDFSPAMYREIWNGWDSEELSVGRYFERVQAIIHGAEKDDALPTRTTRQWRPRSGTRVPHGHKNQATNTSTRPGSAQGN